MALTRASLARIAAELPTRSIVYDTGIMMLAKSTACGKSRRF
jgi:hypothetical protein